eukprot:COSAG05_NODE_407_length_10145_cov_234.042604_7_plen_105_part_00
MLGKYDTYGPGAGGSGSAGAFSACQRGEATPDAVAQAAATTTGVDIDAGSADGGVGTGMAVVIGVSGWLGSESDTVESHWHFVRERWVGDGTAPRLSPTSATSC